MIAASIGTVMLLVNTILLASTPSDDSLVPTTLALRDGRLFVSAEQRSALDHQSDPVSDTPEPAESEVQVSSESMVRAPARLQKRKLVTARLDGVVMRSDGKVDVWVNGSLISGNPDSDVKVLYATSSGPVVLGIDQRVYSLYPGESVQYLPTRTPVNARAGRRAEENGRQ